MLTKLYEVITFLLIIVAVSVLGYVFWKRDTLFTKSILHTINPPLYTNLVETSVKVPDAWVNYATPVRDKPLYAVNGTSIILFSASLNNPTNIEVIGDYVVVSETNSGNIVVLKDLNGDKSADAKKTFVSGLDGPYGVSFFNNDLYVATKSSVLKYVNFIDQYENGSNKAEVVVTNLPHIGLNSFKSIVVGVEGRILVHFGSSCNDCIEQDKRRGSIVSYNLSGGDEKIYSSGLKNIFDLVVFRGEIYALEDNISLIDGDSNEEINLISSGENYGWPQIYNDSTKNLKYSSDFLVNYRAPLVMFDPKSDAKGLALFNDKFNVQKGALIPFSGSGGPNSLSKKLGLLNFDTGEVTDVLSFWTGKDTYLGSPYAIANYGSGWLLSDTDNGFIYYLEF